jgi:ribosome-associated toxin RatA of RatAB toxin-antitoxin module
VTRTTIGVHVQAAPRLVFDLARGVERWERLLPHYGLSRVRDRRSDGSLVVDFIARRPLIGWLGLGLPVTWRARTWNEPDDLRLRFVHVAGVTKGMDVTWRIEAIEGGTAVTIEHAFGPNIPGLARIVDRFFTRPIAGRTLATFKALAEAITDGGESDPQPVTNPQS